MRIKLLMTGGEAPVSEYPLGLGYLIANLRGHTVEITKDKESLFQDCDIIGLSSTSWGLKDAVDILRRSEVPVVIGGQGVLWEGLNEYPFKHIVKGPGEVILQSILDGEATEVQVQAGTNPKDIDYIKFPERGRCGPTVPILTSRGCPFDCAFCSSQIYWDRASFHSAEYVAEEIEYLLKTYPHMKALYILDDLFIAKKSRVRELAEIWRKKGWSQRFTVRGFVRADLFDKGIGLDLKAMGWDGIRFGAESGNNRVLSLLGKTSSVEKNQRAIDIGQEIGMPVSASFMHHIPGETDDERQDTLDFIEKNKGRLQVAGYYRFQPFPGTAMYDGTSPVEDDMRVRPSDGGTWRTGSQRKQKEVVPFKYTEPPALGQAGVTSVDQWTENEVASLEACQ